MTAQSTEAGIRTVNDEVDVRFSSSGAPLAMRWRGRIWQAVGEPVSWSSSSSWWEPGNTPANRQGSLITTRAWRFQAQTGPVSPTLEFDISSDPQTDGWRLRRIAGAE
ncbi:DUF6504 family protein [Arthrobacter sp. 260]|uniref:DUF6504 family protein n=1 Tax=Arthrobacter sp. 260 TaxID=2735314 RepID=UPI0014918113|nr:DUF6504 family protein [Arthrobacter sp. 260]NOJ60632.1 hypothetical protein [Arthrobacter sp. 260]